MITKAEIQISLTFHSVNFARVTHFQEHLALSFEMFALLSLVCIIVCTRSLNMGIVNTTQVTSYVCNT